MLNGGGVRCWGENGDGQLSDGTTTGSAVPVPVTGITTATKVAAGGGHTCALLDDGTVYCWGSNTSGRLGNGSTISSTVPVMVSAITDADQLEVS
ncbi:MAG: hypothetical protein R2754_08715 [Microthrixaceae bacterium]